MYMVPDAVMNLSQPSEVCSYLMFNIMYAVKLNSILSWMFL